MRPNLDRLTPKESGILKLAARGLTDKQVARELAISIHTVNAHWTHIRQKLGSLTKTELVILYLRDEKDRAAQMENEPTQVATESIHRQALDDLPIATSVIDNHGYLHYANHSMVEHFALDPRGLHLQNLLDFVATKDQPLLRALIDDLLADSEVEHRDAVMSTWVAKRMGQPSRAILLFRSITTTSGNRAICTVVPAQLAQAIQDNTSKRAGTSPLSVL